MGYVFEMEPDTNQLTIHFSLEFEKCVLLRDENGGLVSMSVGATSWRKANRDRREIYFEQLHTWTPCHVERCHAWLAIQQQERRCLIELFQLWTFHARRFHGPD